MARTGAVSSAAGSPSYCPAALPQKAQSQPRGTRHRSPCAVLTLRRRCPFPLVRGSLLWSRGTEPEPTLFASFGHTPKGAKTLMYGSKTPLHSAKTMNCAPKIQSFSFFRSFPPCCCWVWVTTGPTTLQSLTRVRANPSIRGWVSAVVAAPLPYNAHDRKT